MVIMDLDPLNRIWQGIAGTIELDNKLLKTLRNNALAEIAGKEQEAGRETEAGLGGALTDVIPASMILIDLVSMMARWWTS